MTVRIFNRLNISIILYVVYYLQGVLYPSGSFFSQFFILIFLLIGIQSLCKTVLYNKNPLFIRVWLILYLVLAFSFIVSPKIVYGTLYESIGTVETFDQFKGMSIFCLSLFIPFSHIRKYGIKDSYISNITIIFFILMLIRYFFNKDILSIERDSFTNNVGYFAISVLPYIIFFFKKNRIIALIMFISITLIVIDSAKRGAIVCLAISVLFSVVYYLRMNKLSLKRLCLLLLLMCAFAVVAYYGVMRNEYLQMRIETTHEDGIGTRSIAYYVLWHHWMSETNLIKLLFGNGISGSVSVWGNYAHNDWLELLIDNGLIGVLLYATFFCSTFVYVNHIKLSFSYKCSAYLILIIWVLKTFFSMGYTEGTNAVYIILLGIILGNNEYRKKHYTY